MPHRNHGDRITLAGIKLCPRIGVSREERAEPQKCEADLSIWGSFQNAAASDSMDLSIDYCRILETVQNTAKEGEYALVETLAHRIVRNVLHEYPVDRVRVKLRKYPASLRDQIDFIEVEVEEPQ